VQSTGSRLHAFKNLSALDIDDLPKKEIISAVEDIEPQDIPLSRFPLAHK